MRPSKPDMPLSFHDIINVTTDLTEGNCEMTDIFNCTPEDISSDSLGFSSTKNATMFNENVTELWNLVQNGSHSESSIELIPIIIVSVVSLISLTTFLGNIAIILCIVKSRRMLTVYNIYTASLALADLLVGVGVMTNMAVYTYYGYWPLGNEMCTVWILLDFICCTVSMLHLDAIAFDRYKSVTSPLVYRTTFTKSRAVKISMGMWFLGVVLWLPPVLWFRITDDINEKTVEDDCFFLPDKYFIICQASMAYFCPVCFMVVMYLMLFCALNKRVIKAEKPKETVTKQTIYTVQISSNMTKPITPRHQVRESSSQETSFNNEQISKTSSHVKQKNKTSNNSIVTSKKPRMTERSSREIENAKISSQNSRCIRTLGAIIVVFLVCWLPFIIFWPLTAFCEYCVPASLYETSYWLAYGNSFLNPYIYFVSNRDFRRAFGKVFCRRSFDSSSRLSGASNNSS